MPSPAKFDLTTRRGSRSTPTIRVHRSRTLRPSDITEDDGLRITTVSRTLIDLASALGPHRLERVVHRAEHLRLLDATPLRTAGSPALRQAIQALASTEPQITRSELEERFLSLILNAQFPRPEVNATVGPFEVDFLWRKHRLIVEVDGAGTHLTAAAFEEDRRRDAQLSVMGFRVVRFTYRQVVEQPRATMATLAVLLAGDE